MIVLLDVNNKRISLYGKEGMVVIPFRKANDLFDYIEDKNVYYITNAMEVNAYDIVNMIQKMGVQVESSAPVETGIKYLHGIGDETIYINDELKFKGKFDLRIMDEAMNRVIQENPILQQLIKNKKIEVIGEIKKRKLIHDFKIFQAEEIKKQREVDSSLDRILLDERVEDYKGLPPDEYDAKEIDIMGGGSAIEGASVNTMSELLSEMEGME
ncbi:MAG: hypothetical protein ACTSSP_01095 [Candidatus Asgardarchaeia archaeon]